MGVDRHRRVRAALEHPQRDVGGDPVEPGPEGSPRLEAGDRPPGVEERLLQRVVGVMQRPEQPVAVEMQRLSVGRGEADERRFLPPPGGREEPGFLAAGVPGRAHGPGHRGGGTGRGPPSSVHGEGL